ncbi:hypothetical protein [Streptomyces sp. NPDC088847]|uniref:hypothetical protein n=1 Tax=Streptomyces sp. NPDC088847 TaxID=3365909 RepID=UPI0038261F0C
MGGQVVPEDGDGQEEAGEQRRERRRLVRQLLIDWSPVLATLTSLAVRHFS